MFWKLLKKSSKKSSKMMQKSISKPPKIHYKIDMPKSIGTVLTNCRKISKMGPKGTQKSTKSM